MAKGIWKRFEELATWTTRLHNPDHKSSRRLSLVLKTQLLEAKTGLLVANLVSEIPGGKSLAGLWTCTAGYSGTWATEAESCGAFRVITPGFGSAIVVLGFSTGIVRAWLAFS